MKMAKTVLAGLLILFGSPPFATAQTNDEKRTVEFYNGWIGRWEGQLHPTSTQPFSPLSPEEATEAAASPGTPFAFSITADSAKVYTKAKDGSWSEVKAGNFHLLTAATNAILFAMTADLNTSTKTGGWVETWNFTITHKERDSLDVVWTRAVNNFTHSSDYNQKIENGYDTGRFFSIRYGEMTRADTTAK